LFRSGRDLATCRSQLSPAGTAASCAHAAADRIVRGREGILKRFLFGQSRRLTVSMLTRGAGALSHRKRKGQVWSDRARHPCLGDRRCDGIWIIDPSEVNSSQCKCRLCHTEIVILIASNASVLGEASGHSRKVAWIGYWPGPMCRECGVQNRVSLLSGMRPDGTIKHLGM